MLWSDIPAGLRSLTGVVEGAVAERATTSELWATTKAAAAELGISTAGWTIQAMNQLRHSAASIRTAAEELSRAANVFGGTGLDQTLTADMISTPVWGRSMVDQQLAPEYLVRVGVEVAIPPPYPIPGWEPKTTVLWKTISTSRLPTTVHGLSTMISEAQGEWEKKYDVQTLGVVGTQILSV